MAIGQQVTKPGMGSGAPAPLPSGGMQGTNTGYVQPGSQFSQQSIQRSAQQRVPFQGQFNGNPRGAANMPRNSNMNPFGFPGQGMAPAWSQQTNLGRYRPPTMNGMGGYNSNQWNDMGGMDYNLPGSYGSPLGQGQFAPMPQMFQQYLEQMGGYMPQRNMMGRFPNMMMMGPQYMAPNEEVYNPTPPGKDGRPLMEGPAPIPSYDTEFSRNYNMGALRQMMMTNPNIYFQ